jgi:DNA-binding CsgD family transcriptional regulator
MAKISLTPEQREEAKRIAKRSMRQTQNLNARKEGISIDEYLKRTNNNENEKGK